MSNVERLPRETADITNENIERIGAMFPNCLTEAKDERGRVVKAIDFDKLRQELSYGIVEGPQERYQFTWPEKRKAMLLANTPTSMTLRPCREESVNFDTTQNLYIEGDNLDVLKLLRENYLGKVKMIYIDPPYNTGKDSFVYDDDFSKSVEEFAGESEATDEVGNRNFDLRQNNESNGRFHTDWLNMMYPRLKVAKDLMSDDGVIFVHIDENEISSLLKILSEVLGANNELGVIVWDKRNPKGAVYGVAYQHEYIVAYCKNLGALSQCRFTKKKEHAEDMIKKVKTLVKSYGVVNDDVRRKYEEWIKENKKEFSGGEIAYSLIDELGRIYQEVSMAAPDKPETRSHRPLVHPVTGQPCPVPAKGWRFTDKRMDELLEQGRIAFGPDENTQPRQKYFLDENMDESVSSLLYFGGSDDALGVPFDNPKPVYVAQRLISTVANGNDIVVDFFSGSATAAHAVMKLNADDGGKRKFIMVQIPEDCPEKGEAAKAGYKNICEIGKERIRRAGNKVMEEWKETLEIKDKNARVVGETLFANVEVKGEALDDTSGKLFKDKSKQTPPDIGFRVLKLDSSNMEDVFMSPAKFAKEAMQGTLDFGGAPEAQQTAFNFDGDASLASNIKPGRTAEDLLFQAMLRLDIPLSAKIETEEIHGKKVFSVMDGHLLATFDKDVNEEVIAAIAKRKPGVFVMCDGGFATDNVADNFEQIWREYSPETVRRVI